MSDHVVVLKSGAYARILVERRCAECGQWLSGRDCGHSTFGRLINGHAICTGKGVGRKRTRIWSAMPTEQQREQVVKRYPGHPEYHPLLKWRTATVLERQEIQTLGG